MVLVGCAKKNNLTPFLREVKRQWPCGPIPGSAIKVEAGVGVVEVVNCLSPLRHMRHIVCALTHVNSYPRCFRAEVLGQLIHAPVKLCG